MFFEQKLFFSRFTVEVLKKKKNRYEIIAIFKKKDFAIKKIYVYFFKGDYLYNFNQLHSIH